jgi:transposase
LQLARYRETFSPGGAKDDLPDADLLSELLYCHRDRLKVWKPDTELNRKLAFFNEGRREAVDECTRLSNAIKSQLKVYFPLALELLDDDTSTVLAADLLLKWPTQEALQNKIFIRCANFSTLTTAAASPRCSTARAGPTSQALNPGSGCHRTGGFARPDAGPPAQSATA